MRQSDGSKQCCCRSSRKNSSRRDLMWKIWCKALGNKAFENTKQADKVAYVRTAWVLLHITTCCFIIAGNIKALTS